MSDGIVLELRALTEAVYYLADRIAVATQQKTTGELAAEEEARQKEIHAHASFLAQQAAQTKISMMQSGKSPDALPAARPASAGPRKAPAAPTRAGGLILGAPPAPVEAEEAQP